MRLRLILSGRTESLLALWSAVGYEYNHGRSRLAALAVQYLRHKQRVIAERECAAGEAQALAVGGERPGTILERLAGRGWAGGSSSARSTKDAARPCG